LSDAVNLADRYWAYYRDSAQMWNIDRGDVDQIAAWEDFTPAGVSDRLERLRMFEQQATSPGSTVDVAERSLLAAVGFSARATAATLPFERDLSLVAGPFNIVTFLSVLVPGYALTTAEDGNGYVTKLRSLPSFLNGWVAGLRDGMAAGRVATRRGVNNALAGIDSLLAREIGDDPMLSQDPPREMSRVEIEQWRASVASAIRDEVRPALADLRTVLLDELLPHSRSDDEAGLCHLVDGDAAYQSLLTAATSTELTPDEVHQLGLERLALIDDEYAVLGRSVLGVAGPRVVRERLRDDDSLRYDTTEEIIADAMAALGRAEAAAPGWFNRMPRATCRAVPTNAGSMAYYTAPSPDGARDGTFFFKVSDPRSWMRYQLEVTTFHEAVPGHHLQLALAQELNLHPVLGELEVTSYSEGWGLYAERLADEMGLYKSELDRIGMLATDSLRAARLVVDTGLHARGWSRETAIDFLLDNTPLERSNAESEIDRYIAVPGQATSYMVGRLEIERLRSLAQRHQPQRFTLSAFHEIVLNSGMSPLDDLARRVTEWIDR
jgi:uncharacterized protein (DUF885 family)